ncbi:MAG: hypothetical protein BWY09_02122 [Candidatus Hydrogenedentes bacterium ADurb.Bin179]|nr:MAG: hypothetical protein BWY09_02122 [Candidatus Hydrogenedentes bacterium ADurb.Bin179]
MQSIGGGEGGKACFGGARHGEVFFFRRGIRPGIQKRGEIMGVGRLVRQHDVIDRLTTHCKEAQFGSRPQNAVFAFRTTGDLVVGTVLARFRKAPIIHPVEVAVFQHGYIATIPAFPRLIKKQGGGFMFRCVQDLPHIFKALCKVPIHKQLPSRTDIHGSIVRPNGQQTARENAK